MLIATRRRYKYIWVLMTKGGISSPHSGSESISQEKQRTYLPPFKADSVRVEEVCNTLFVPMVERGRFWFRKLLLVLPHIHSALAFSQMLENKVK